MRIAVEDEVSRDEAVAAVHTGYDAFKDKRYTGPGSGLGDEWGYELNDARTRKFESPLQRCGVCACVRSRARA